MHSGKTDKLLIGIVAGIILLVAVAFAVVFLQPKPTYRSEDAAEGVVFNYLFALWQEEYGRAYPYLSNTLEGRPKTSDDFARQVRRNDWIFPLRDSSTTWQVEGARVVGDSTAVPVRITRYYSNSLFGTNSSERRAEFVLLQEDGNWRIVSSNDWFVWLDCWEFKGGCK